MGASRAVIHCNPGLAHQINHAECFTAGFQRHGQACEISSRPDAEADIHVVLGPHYALKHWINHPRCIWLDRAYWGDPECVTVGWAAGGGRRFPLEDGHRPAPELQPWREGRNAIVLADYGDKGDSMVALARPHVDRLELRRHPAEGGTGTLSGALRDFHIAIGKRSTALVEAAICGLSIVCLDPTSAVLPVASTSIKDIVKPDRREWLRRLSWANWSADEIRTGDLWDSLTRCA